MRFFDGLDQCGDLAAGSQNAGSDSHPRRQGAGDDRANSFIVGRKLAQRVDPVRTKRFAIHYRSLNHKLRGLFLLDIEQLSNSADHVVTTVSQGTRSVEQIARNVQPASLESLASKGVLDHHQADFLFAEAFADLAGGDGVNAGEAHYRQGGDAFQAAGQFISNQCFNWFAHFRVSVVTCLSLILRRKSCNMRRHVD